MLHLSCYCCHGGVDLFGGNYICEDVSNEDFG